MSDTTVAVIGGRDLQIWVWVAAILLYGIGDTATTLWGLSVGGVAEAGPVAGPLIEVYGPRALLLVKATVFGSFYAVWVMLRTPGRIAVPLALALVGGGVTAWNLLVVASVT
ncbi:hypothetical protein [Natronomonas moolapensis]|uniref:hypothetical protein n=1 Tax=Natronomonas moolapensis TaxID=416273 RepID=UPI0006776716|nr:hypothetical protein [Natronomonas moolapensis]